MYKIHYIYSINFNFQLTRNVVLISNREEGAWGTWEIMKEGWVMESHTEWRIFWEGGGDSDTLTPECNDKCCTSTAPREQDTPACHSIYSNATQCNASTERRHTASSTELDHSQAVIQTSHCIHFFCCCCCRFWWFISIYNRLLLITAHVTIPHCALFDTSAIYLISMDSSSRSK